MFDHCTTLCMKGLKTQMMHSKTYFPVTDLKLIRLVTSVVHWLTMSISKSLSQKMHLENVIVCDVSVCDHDAAKFKISST